MSYNSTLLPVVSIGFTSPQGAAVQNATVDHHLVVRIRDRCKGVPAKSMTQCSYTNCRQATRRFADDELVDIYPIDAPLAGQNGTNVADVIACHAACSKQWHEEREGDLFAANHVVLPKELVEAEIASARVPSDYTLRLAPSTIEAARAYELQCQQLTIQYAAPDSVVTTATADGKTTVATSVESSFVVSMPMQAASVLPIDAAIINELTFSSLFRRRAVLTIGLTKDSTVTLLDRTMQAVMDQVMGESLTPEQKADFIITQKGKMEAVSHTCQAAVFRHPFRPSDPQGRTWYKLVIDLAFPAEMLQLTLGLFNSGFLQPDGDTLRETDKMVWQRMFLPPDALPDRPEATATLLDGTVVAANNNSTRQLWNHKTWARKLHTRRNFLTTLVANIETRLNSKISKGASVSRDSANDYFCSRWADNVTTVTQSIKEAQFQFMVNAQPVATLNMDRDSEQILYIMASDNTQLMCVQYDSAEQKPNRFEYLPCTYAGDMDELTRELTVRHFKIVNQGEVQAVYPRSGK